MDKNGGSDDNSGFSPEAAFETIGAALAVGIMADGDAISIKAGTYTETGLDLDHAAAEIGVRLVSY